MPDVVVGEVSLILRLPPDLHAKLKALAERDERSLNREIVYLLKQAAEDEDDGQARRGSARQD